MIGSMVSAYYSYLTLQTGQTTTFTTGDDGNLRKGVSRSYTGPSRHSTYTNDYTTTDNATGLVWKSCFQGLSGADCLTGTATTLTNDGTANDASNDPTYGCLALNSANSGNGYAGITSWRLPTAIDAGSLSFFGISGFPNINVFNHFWTSTFSQGSSTLKIWRQIASYMASDTITNSNYVLCVSGESQDDSKSFTDNGDGTITDNITKLIWKKCAIGQTNDSSCSGTATQDTWANSIGFCNSLNLSGKVWRHPNTYEMLSIIQITKSTAPMIDLNYFPNSNLQYWTSTTIYNSSQAQIFSYNNGFLWSTLKTDNSYYTRCVSGP